MIGVVVWLMALISGISVLIAFSRIHRAHIDSWNHVLAILLVFSVIVQYTAYFWGGGHLARAKGYSSSLLIFGLLLPLQPIILPLLLFALPDKCPPRSSSRQSHSQPHSHNESTVARVVRYRRNALIACGLGLGGIFIALSFVFAPGRIFETRDAARVTGILVFVPSYAAVIYGAWWWARAKHWPDAVIIIGLLPLAIFFIRYVRLIYLQAPLLLPVGMLIMPIILLGVVAVLPDKSGLPKRKHWDQD